MNDSWSIVLGVGVATFAMKNSGLWLRDPKRLPAFLVGALPLLAPALLAAFVALGAVTGAAGVGVDARLGGLLVCCGLLWKGAPLWLVLVATAATTALLRLL